MGAALYRKMSMNPAFGHARHRDQRTPGHPPRHPNAVATLQKPFDPKSCSPSSTGCLVKDAARGQWIGITSSSGGSRTAGNQVDDA
ncbi:MAG: hypothetical protein ACLSAH_05010 [Bilophila wadsworthia]